MPSEASTVPVSPTRYSAEGSPVSAAGRARLNASASASGWPPWNANTCLAARREGSACPLRMAGVNCALSQASTAAAANPSSGPARSAYGERGDDDGVLTRGRLLVRVFGRGHRGHLRGAGVAAGEVRVDDALRAQRLVTVTADQLGCGLRLGGAEPRGEGAELGADELLAAVAAGRLQPADAAAVVLRAALALECHRAEIELRGAVAKFRQREKLAVRGVVMPGVVFAQRRLEIGPRNCGRKQRTGGRLRGTSHALTVGTHSSLLSGSALYDRRDAHAARRAHRDQAAPRVRVECEDLGKRREDARAGGRERMTKGDAAALHVQPGAIDAAKSRRQSQHVTAVIRRLPRLERAQHLGGQRPIIP